MSGYSVLVDLNFNSVGKIINLVDGVSAQDAVTVSQLKSAMEGLAWKDSARVASIVNVTLATPGATIDGITMAGNDRVLLKDQTTNTENGLYIWNGASTAMTRTLDANVFEELEGAAVSVEQGTSANTTYRQTAVNGTIGTDAIAWTTFGTAAPSASETTAGIMEIATQVETDAGTDDLRAITPLKLTNFVGRAKRFSGTIGDGTSTSIAVAHNLGTRDVNHRIYLNSGTYEDALTTVEHTDINTLTFKFLSAPASNAYRVNIVA